MLQNATVFAHLVKCVSSTNVSDVDTHRSSANETVEPRSNVAPSTKAINFFHCVASFYLIKFYKIKQKGYIVINCNLVTILYYEPITNVKKEVV